MTQPNEAVAWLSGMNARAAARRDGVLASDAEREKVCELLNSGFADGRITAAELDERTTRALSARTHGELVGVVAGLGAMGNPALWATSRHGVTHPGRRVAFWVVAFFTAPFMSLGSMLLLFGSDGGDRVFGIVLIVLFAPGLLALHRWAHPRH